MEFLVLHTIAILVALSACAMTSGVFLFLQRASLLTDAVSHALLLGVVIAFMAVHSVSSPWLSVGALLASFGTVLCTQWIVSTKRLADDVAIGLIFTLFFSGGVLLLSHYAGSIHLDTDMIMFGEITVAPLYRFIVGGMDLGPSALWLFTGVGLLHVLVLRFYYTALVYALFDPVGARVAGIPTGKLSYVMVILMSITAVSAFNIIGSSAFVALAIVPAVCGYLIALTMRQLWVMSMASSLSIACGGYALALWCDASVTGAIGVVAGFVLLLVATCSLVGGRNGSL